MTARAATTPTRCAAADTSADPVDGEGLGLDHTACIRHPTADLPRWAGSTEERESEPGFAAWAPSIRAAERRHRAEHANSGAGRARAGLAPIGAGPSLKYTLPRLRPRNRSYRPPRSPVRHRRVRHRLLENFPEDPGGHRHSSDLRGPRDCSTHIPDQPRLLAETRVGRLRSGPPRDPEKPERRRNPRRSDRRTAHRSTSPDSDPAWPTVASHVVSGRGPAPRPTTTTPTRRYERPPDRLTGPGPHSQVDVDRRCERPHRHHILREASVSTERTSVGLDVHAAVHRRAWFGHRHRACRAGG